MSNHHRICAVAIGIAALHIIACPLQAVGQTRDQKAEPLWKKGIYAKSVPEPTEKNVRYGNHKRNVLDFWKAESDSPTPIVISIHGGGWNGGDKSQLHSFVDTNELLKAGISVAAINYRFIKQSAAFSPPVKGPLSDAALAVQFIRSKAERWNIDSDKIAATGGSAGACTSLWLAYHDDLADLESTDPVARQSTRLMCVAALRAQTTLDPRQMKSWMPNSKYGGHAFGKATFDEFLSGRDELMPLISRYSPYSLLDQSDPPTYLFYPITPADRNAIKNPTHSTIFGVELQKRCREVGVVCELAYPGAPDVKHSTATEYLINTLNHRREDF